MPVWYIRAGIRYTGMSLQDAPAAVAASPCGLEIHAAVAVQHGSPQQDLHIFTATTRRMGIERGTGRRRDLGPCSLPCLEHRTLPLSGFAEPPLTRGG